MRVRRALPTVVAIVAAVVAISAVGSIALVGRTWLEGTSRSEQTFSGFSTPDSDIRVANLTISGGRITVGYSVDVLLIPRGRGSSIQCRLIDTSGRLDFFDASTMPVQPGRWTTIAFDATYELPELTLGLRCSPDVAGPFTVVLRDAEIHAIPYYG